MNIVIISSDFEIKKSGRESFEKAELFRLAKESRNMHLSLAKEFSALGANVLFIEPKASQKKSGPTIRFFQEDGISKAAVQTGTDSAENSFSSKEALKFCGTVLDNSACLGGVFLPDVVISSGCFPFGAGAGAEIAKETEAVLITDLFCFPKEILPKAKAFAGANPVLILIKKAQRLAFEKSDAVLGFFSASQKVFSGAQKFFPLDIPAPKLPKEISSAGLSLYEKLSAFREGGNFVLACALPLENGFSLEELISSAGETGGRFSLVFLSGGTKKRRFQSLIAEKGITNVFFLEEAPEEELPYILSGADAVFTAENSQLKGFAPQQSRFYAALLSGKPVLAVSENWNAFLKKSGGAVISKPRNKESLRLGIKALLEMSQTDRESLGLSALSFCEKNSAKNFAKEYFSLLQNLSKQKEN